TAEAVRLQKETILRHYVARMDDLWRRLSYSDEFLIPGEPLRRSLDRDAALFPEIPTAPEREPYRRKCRFISAKLNRTLEYVRGHVPDWGEEEHRPPPGIYVGRQDLLDDLNLIADDLRRCGASAAAEGALHDVIRLV